MSDGVFDREVLMSHGGFVMVCQMVCLIVKSWCHMEVLSCVR